MQPQSKSKTEKKKRKTLNQTFTTSLHYSVIPLSTLEEKISFKCHIQHNKSSGNHEMLSDALS